MAKTVRIGAGSGTFVDSREAIPQLLRKGGHLDYLVFDCLAEGVMPSLGRAQAAGGVGYVADFVDGQMRPHLGEILRRGIRVISNAGGLDPKACAEALRARAEEEGLKPRIAYIVGDNLIERMDDFITDDTRDMFDGSLIKPKLAQAQKVVSLVVYTGAFPIAAALDAGADIVITGRVVDSAATLGALIHEFGWDIDDYDKLSAGTLGGHLIECSTQVTGGTFTDWRDVPDWSDIGFPIIECEADGTLVLTKPEGTGGLVSEATVGEQLLYEVSDPQHYFVPDVVCDFSEVRLRQVGDNRVQVSGARGLGRPNNLKGSVSYDYGWRCIAVLPVIGREAGAKAKRMSEELIARTTRMLRDRQMPPVTYTHYDVFGGESETASTAIYRIVVDHPELAGIQLFQREQSSIMTGMSPGTTNPLGVTMKPVQGIAGFPIARDRINVTVAFEGKNLTYKSGRGHEIDAPAPRAPEPPPKDVALDREVPLIQLAWARSGEKGDLFNVGVLARKPEYLPYIYQALTPEVVGAHYGRVIGDGEQTYKVDRFNVPGFHAFNLVVHGAMEGGMAASARVDSIAKGMAQLLLDIPIAVPAAIADKVGAP